MSIEKVLRQIGDEHAVKLADAWSDHEREHQARLGALAVEIDKGTNRASLGLGLSGFTLAAFLAGSYLLGSEVGGLKQSVVTLQEETKQLQADTRDLGLSVKSLEERFRITEELIRGIDECTKRIEQKQQAGLAPEPNRTPVAG